MKIKKEELERLKRAQDLWDQASFEPTNLGHSTYLSIKKIKPYGLRYGRDHSDNDVIIVPICNLKGELQAVQLIQECGDKRIHGLKKGNLHLIGEIQSDSIIFVCEGYATGASVHESINQPTVIAIDCGNLEPSIAALSKKYPNHKIIIAADDDVESKDNPGRTKALDAAKCHNCEACFPKFPEDFTLPDGKKPTDFNDLHIHFGIEEVGRQLQNKRPRLISIGISEFISLNLPPRKMILSPWLPSQGLVMIYAPRGIGKTFLALSVGYVVASGGSILKWKAEEAKKVLYIDGEMPQITMQERLISIARSSEKTPPDDSYFRLVTPDLQRDGTFIRDLATKEGQGDAEELLHDTDLLILDNISTLIKSGGENESESWIAMQEWSLSLRRAGKSVLFIHHAGKGGQQRGTSKREDVLDSVISLKRSKDYSPSQGASFEVHFEKSRGFGGDDAKPFEVTLVDDDEGRQQWIFREMETRDLDRVVEFSNNGMTQRDIAKEMEISVGKVNKLIKQAKNEGLIK